MGNSDEKSRPSSLLLCEWALSLEQEREELIGARRALTAKPQGRPSLYRRWPPLLIHECGALFCCPKTCNSRRGGLRSGVHRDGVPLQQRPDVGGVPKLDDHRALPATDQTERLVNAHLVPRVVRAPAHLSGCRKRIGRRVSYRSRAAMNPSKPFKFTERSTLSNQLSRGAKCCHLPTKGLYSGVHSNHASAKLWTPPPPAPARRAGCSVPESAQTSALGPAQLRLG